MFEQCGAVRWQPGEQKRRRGAYHGARREVGYTVLRCDLEAAHDGLHRSVWRGHYAYWVADEYR